MAVDKGRSASRPSTSILESSENKLPADWSPDGRFILFSSEARFWMLPVSGERKPKGPLAIGGNPAISPNGRWVAYAVNETGRPEVYVGTFPPSGSKWMV